MTDFSPMEQEYRRDGRKKMILVTSIIIVAVAVAFCSLFLSRYGGLSPSIAWDVIVAHLHGEDYPDYYPNLITWDYYVPRALLGLFVGAGLGVGGAVMQSLMRNPLADPYTTGVASGASFGAALFIILGISLIPTPIYDLQLTINASILALIPTAAIVLISQKKTMTPTTTILAGVAVMYVFRAATSLMTLSAEPELVEQLYLWNIGTLGVASWSNIGMMIMANVIGIIILSFASRQITIMTAGDRNAGTMGVRTRLVRPVCLIIVALMTAITVGYVGTIGFMGLVAPHIARILVGSNLKHLIPASAACGAAILIICDCIAKLITFTGMPVGVITSIIGGPIFIILLIKGAKKVWY